MIKFGSLIYNYLNINFLMGNKQPHATSIKEKDEMSKYKSKSIEIVIGKNSFEFNYVVGKGGFGKVRI
jgi:hypothetical protein